MPMILPLDEEIVVSNRNKMVNLLFRMSKTSDIYSDDDSDLEDIISEIQSIYRSGYRHLYSDIYPVIVNIYNTGGEEALEILSTNLDVVRRYVAKNVSSDEHDGKYDPGLFGHVLKLYDHVSIEIQRLLENKRTYANIKEISDSMSTLYSKFDDLDKLNRELTETSDKLLSKLKKIQRKVKNLQTQSIVILGIFAAIVMAFSGGMTIFGSSLAGMMDVNPYKIAFVVLLCGFIVYNMLAVLMEYLYRIVFELSEEESSAFSRLWHVISINAILISMMIVDLVAWNCSGLPLV
ncbi:MAG: hypothetical protein IKC93_04165 [Candidatus Methanomethylophilaceae archaeon]|nr:hypothetical protein [Candidatus Methanomethylophilaceae archaeon]